MIRYKTLKIKNFLSFGNVPTEVSLDEQQLLLIIGNNLDVGEEGNSKNGVGKSTIYQAVTYALYGLGLEDDIKQDEFVNLTNKKNMEVSLEFEVNNVPATITRTRKPNSCDFYVNGESLTRDSLKNTNDEIVKFLGLNYTVFVNTTVLSPDIKPFLSMKPSEQRSFIEEVLSLNVLVERAETLKSLQKDNQTEHKIEQEKINGIVRDNENLQNQIDSIISKIDAWENNRKNRLDDITRSLEDHTSLDIDRYKQNHERFRQIQECIDKKEGKLKEARSRHDLTKSRHDSIKKEKDNLENLLEKHDLHEKALKEKKETLERRKKDLEKIDINEIRKVHKEIDGYMEEKERIEKHTQTLTKEIANEIKEKKNLKIEVDSLRSGKCPYCKQDYTSPDEINRLEDSIKAIEDKLEALNSKVEKSEHDLNDIFNKIEQLLAHCDELDPKDVDKIEHDLTSINEQLEDIDTNSVNPFESSIQEILERTSVDEIDGQLDEYEHELKNVQQTIILLEDNIKQAEQERDSIDVSVSMDELDLVKEKIKDLKNEKKQVENETCPHEETLKELKKNFKDVDDRKLKEYEERNEHYKMLIRMLTDNKSYIRKNIVDQYIPFLNKKINEYLLFLGAPHNVEIMNDLSVEILYMDTIVGYGACSKGEKLRMNLSVSLAFRDLISMFGMKSNLLMIDEFLDSAIDPAGLKRILSLLEGYAEHVMLISHREELESKVNRILTVTKKNGFSHLTYQ